MTLLEFIEKYGTRTAPALLRIAAEHLTDPEVANELVNVASDLESALTDYIGKVRL